MSKKVLVIGAAGDVGRGVVQAADERGWEVTGAGRDLKRLGSLTHEHPNLRTTQLDASNDLAVREYASEHAASYDAIVVSVNPAGLAPYGLLGANSDDISAHLDSYLRAHLVCASELIPLMRPDSTYLGIGGGMADAVFRGLGTVSMAQAAQRMAYRHLAKEARVLKVKVFELIIHSMVAGASNREDADPAWITDGAVGSAVCDLLAEADERRDPIVDLRP